MSTYRSTHDTTARQLVPGFGNTGTQTVGEAAAVPHWYQLALRHGPEPLNSPRVPSGSLNPNNVPPRRSSKTPISLG